MQIQTALAKIVESKNLSREESAQVFNLIMTGETTDAQIGAFLAAMRVKGETAEELTGAAETMRNLSSKVPLTSTEKLVDTCGTCLLYTTPSPRDRQKSRMPSSA